MSDDNAAFGFGKFVPGFDFLQNLASSAVKGASAGLPQMPSLSNWIAPTLNVEELEKRIQELKAVQFWLDQNATALKATIQALEVQKMTLATLKGMNVQFGDVANALSLRAGDVASRITEPVAAVAASVVPSAPPPAPAPAAKPARKPKATAAPAAAVAGVVDPIQWWGALTQQFQEIAGNALKDATAQAAIDTGKNVATSLAKGALKTAAGLATSASKAAVGGGRPKTSRAAPARRTKR